MKLAVISDLHLGVGNRVDGFGHEDSEFLSFLDHLERNFERIVLLGDIWETLTSPLPWQARASLLDARQAHPEIARRFTGRRYTYVHGNHDLIARDVDGAPESLVLSSHGKRILFTHGHGYDRLIHAARHLVELGVCIGGWLRRMGLGGLYSLFAQWEQQRTCTGLDTSCGFQRWAVAAAARVQADIVVTGHTHVGGVSDHGNQLYLNSGSCHAGRFSFLALDTSSDAYSAHQSW